MRNWALLASLLCLTALAAEVTAAPKKQKSASYNATEFIHRREAKTPETAPKVKAGTKATALEKYDCESVRESPTAKPVEVADKPAESAGRAEGSAAHSTQQALEMAKTVIKTVKDNCRTEKRASAFEPTVGVSVVDPGDTGVKDPIGSRPELSGTVGVQATF